MRFTRLRAISHLWAVLTIVACTPAIHSPTEELGGGRTASTPVKPSGVTAFVDVSVVPMDKEQVLTDQTVLVEGGRITAMGPVGQISVPAGAVQIDGRGKFLLPGLSDMHAHLFFATHIASLPLGADAYQPLYSPNADSAGAEARLFMWLSNGVTTVRNVDYSSDEYGKQAQRLRALAAAGGSLIPHIYTAGLWGPDQYINLRADSVGQRWRGSLNKPPVLDSVAIYVADYKARGYDFIKVHEEKPAVLDSLLAAAKRLGIPVVGHVPPPSNVEHVLWGYKSIEHTVNEYLYNGRTKWDPRDTAGFRALAAEMRQAGVWNCPTQAHMDRLHYDISLGDHPNVLKILQDSGVKLLVGTDEPPWQGVVTQELREFVILGLTPYQALLADTRNVAEYFGTLKESGTIAIGKRADMVLLTGNPLQDVRYTAQPAGVMLGGQWLSREDLDRRLAVLKLATVTENMKVLESAPVKNYWHNVMDEAAMVVTPLLFGGEFTKTQDVAKKIFTTYIAQRQALIDSLGTSNQYALGSQRVFHLLAQQMGEVREVLTPEQRAKFDPPVRRWIQHRKAEGYSVDIPGI